MLRRLTRLHGKYYFHDSKSSEILIVADKSQTGEDCYVHRDHVWRTMGNNFVLNCSDPSLYSI